MSITQVCNPNVIVIAKDASLQEAAKLMKESNIGAIVVVDEEGSAKPCGILTDRDMVVKVLTDGVDMMQVRVADIMCNELLTLHEDQNIEDAIDAMREKGVRRAPVVNKAGKLIGITTVDDLLMLIADELNGLAELICRQVSEERVAA